jgi:hypothetical protein
MNVDQGFAGARVIKASGLAAAVVCTTDAAVSIVVLRLHDAGAAHCDLIWLGTTQDLYLAITTAGVLVYRIFVIPYSLL